MQFVCSLNSEVKKYVNPKTGKISAGGNFKSFNENWIPVTESITFISEQVKEGRGLCAWHLVDGKRIKDKTGCIQAGLIIIDIDNIQNISNLKELGQYAFDNDINLHFINSVGYKDILIETCI